MSDHKHDIPDDGKNWWFDQKKNINLIVNIVYVICAGLFVADFFYEKHPYFPIEKVPNFYGFYGFVGCFLLVVAAAQLRKILMRDEDYYQKKEGPSHSYRDEDQSSFEEKREPSDG